MKIKQLLTASLLALAGLVFAAPLAKAYTYADGDLFLGFYDSTGNATKNYLVYIGNYSNFTSSGGAYSGSPVVLNSGTSINFGSASQINADLTTIFGADWYGKVSWGVVGVQDRNHSNTLFATDPNATSTAVAWTPDSSSNQGTAGLDISNLGAVFATNSRGGATAPNASIQPITRAGSYYDYSPLGTVSSGASFDNFSGGIDTTGNTALLTELIATDASSHGTPIAATGSAIVAGQFTLGSDGTITYSAVSTPVSLATLHFDNSSYSVSESGTSVAVTITRDGDTTSACSVNLSTTDGTAISGTDYTGLINSVISFSANQTSAVAKIDVTNRTGYQGDRSFSVGLSSPSSGASITTPSSATVTIQETSSGPAGEIAFGAAAYQSGPLDNQNQPNLVTLTLVRTSGSSGAASVDVSTTNGGTLASGSDFTFTNPTTVNFADGQTSATVNVQLSAIAIGSLPGTIGFQLSNPTGGITIGTQSTALLTVASPGQVAFSGSTYQAGSVDNQNQPSTVSLTLTRTSGSTGAITLDVSPTGGTLVSGSDYTFSNATTVSFADGQTSVNVNIPLNAIAANRLPGTIVLGLSNPTGDASIGSQSSITVTVVNSTPPAPGKIAFSAASYQAAPVDNHGIATTVPVTLTRTNGFDGAVSVSLSVTGGTLTSGSDYTFTSPMTVNFADQVASVVAYIPLKAIAAAKLPGTITLGLSNAQGGATVGTQSTATVTVTAADTVIPKVVITSPKAGAAIISTGTTSFTLTGVASDAKGIDRVEVKFNGGSTQMATLGTFTSGTAGFTLAGLAPQNGSNTMVVQAVDLQGNKSAPVTRTITYSNNRPALAGVYNGLLLSGSGIVPSNNTTGLVNITVTNTGLFTGKVTVGGFVLPINGIFGNDGRGYFKPSLATSTALVGKAAVPVAFGNLSLTLATGTSGKITGQLVDSNSAVVANIDTDKAFYDGKVNLVDAKFLKNKGTYTVVLASKAQQGSPAISSYPQGNGFGTITVSTKGIATVKTTLADGASVTASAPLSKNYQFPCYVQLYSKMGSIAGQITLNGSNAVTSIQGIDVIWFRPAVPTSKVYHSGWTGGVTLDLLGSEYALPVTVPATSVFPGLKAVDPINGNATLEFTDGKLTSPGNLLDKSLNIDPANKVTNLTTNAVLDASFSLKLTASSGAIVGTFTHTDGTKPAFKGVILQNDVDAGAYTLKAGAYGFFLSTAPTNGTSESGGVTLFAK